MEVLVLLLIFNNQEQDEDQSSLHNILSNNE